jgi:hypothetical protein
MRRSGLRSCYLRASGKMVVGINGLWRQLEAPPSVVGGGTFLPSRISEQHTSEKPVAASNSGTGMPRSAARISESKAH